MTIIFVSPTTLLADDVGVCGGASCTTNKFFDVTLDDIDYKGVGCGSVLTMNQILSCLRNGTKFADPVNDTYVFLFNLKDRKTYMVYAPEGEIPQVSPILVDTVSVWGDGADAFFGTVGLLNAGVIERKDAHAAMRALWFHDSHRATRDFRIAGFMDGDGFERIGREYSSSVLCKLAEEIGVDGGHFHAD
jgi:hypothetical protein